MAKNITFNKGPYLDGADSTNLSINAAYLIEITNLETTKVERWMGNTADLNLVYKEYADYFCISKYTEKIYEWQKGDTFSSVLKNDADEVYLYFANKLAEI